MTLCAVEAASWGAEREVPELSRDCVAALLRCCGGADAGGASGR